jgi:hypothetical protein
MKNFWIVTISLMLACSLILIAGCQKAEEKAVEVKDKAVETVAGYSQKGTPSGADLQRHIFEEMPYKQWKLWPGKGKLYKGTEPHGAYITVYVNDKAHESIKNAQGMADNAVVVKENYNAAKQLNSVTVMKKVKGYNPEGADWFWVRFGPDSKVTDEGKIIMCMGCHAVAKDNDYIYTGKVTAKGPPAYSTPGYGKTGESAPGYGKEAPGYGKEAPGYGEGAPGYGEEAPGYGEEAPGYGEEAPGYGEEAPGYGKPGKSAPGYK